MLITFSVLVYTKDIFSMLHELFSHLHNLYLLILV